MASQRNRSSQTSRAAYRFSNGSAGSSGGYASNRAFYVIALFVLLALVFLGRLIYLQVIVSDDYSAKAEEARTSNITSSARRGTIYDRNGVVLATSVEATTIYVNPYEVTDADHAAAQLANILGGEVDSYKEKLTQKDISFVYIKRQADTDVADQIKELKLKGIYFYAEPKRVYPNGQIGGQVVGFANADGEGITGLELYYDDILKGTPGKLVVERGRDGTPIPGGVHEEVAAVDGQDIIISIDIGMQEYLEQSLSEGVTDIGGEGGNAVLMDAGTGEIFATASLPFFNPADTSTVEEGATELKSITQSFEPGSIFKSVSMAAILEAGIATAQDTLYCPAVIYANEYAISDSHERDDQTMTVTEILNRSSNVGISLLTEKLGFSKFYEKILAYNLTKATGVDYPGESSGSLAKQSDWSLVQSYNVSFGQGVAVSPLQMVRFMGALTNEGVEVTPHFLIKKLNDDENIVYGTEQVFENTAAVESLSAMLETVTTEGTGTTAAIEGYKVAGKTGTAEIADSNGYKQGVYNISFIGYLADSSSQLVCFVGATEVPGELQTTSVFKDIMSYAIDRYQIIPNQEG